MSTDSKRTISFTIESAELKQELNRYAKAKGFNNASALARFALFQYKTRYPVKDA